MRDNERGCDPTLDNGGIAEDQPLPPENGYRSSITAVMTDTGSGWKIRAFHNTLVAA